MLTQNLPDMILSTVKELPEDKQQEVYDFASFLKKQRPVAKGGASFDDLVGVLEGPADLSSKHDEIYEFTFDKHTQPVQVESIQVRSNPVAGSNGFRSA